VSIEIFRSLPRFFVYSSKPEFLGRAAPETQGKGFTTQVHWEAGFAVVRPGTLGEGAAGRGFPLLCQSANLPRIMPPQTGATLLQTRLLAPPLQAGIETEDAGKLAGSGSEIAVSFRLFPHLPFRMKWVSRIVEFEIDQYFVDVQARGPFKFWRHRHEFLPSDRNGLPGTTIRDIVEYEIGFGPAGDLADRTFVRPSCAEPSHSQTSYRASTSGLACPAGAASGGRSKEESTGS